MNEDDESIEINKDIDCMIYAAKYGKLAGSPSSQFYVTLVIDGATQTKLAGILGANLKGRVTVTFLNVQPPLEEEDEDDEARGPQIPFLMSGGERVMPHVFRPGVNDPEMCDICGVHQVNVIHDEKRAAEAQDAMASLANTSKVNSAV